MMNFFSGFPGFNIPKTPRVSLLCSAANGLGIAAMITTSTPAALGNKKIKWKSLALVALVSTTFFNMTTFPDTRFAALPSLSAHAAPFAVTTAMYAALFYTVIRGAQAIAELRAAMKARAAAKANSAAQANMQARNAAEATADAQAAKKAAENARNAVHSLSQNSSPIIQIAVSAAKASENMAERARIAASEVCKNPSPLFQKMKEGKEAAQSAKLMADVAKGLTRSYNMPQDELKIHKAEGVIKEVLQASTSEHIENLEGIAKALHRLQNALNAAKIRAAKALKAMNIFLRAADKRRVIEHTLDLNEAVANMGKSLLDLETRLPSAVNKRHASMASVDLSEAYLSVTEEFHSNHANNKKNVAAARGSLHAVMTINPTSESDLTVAVDNLCAASKAIKQGAIHLSTPRLERITQYLDEAACSLQEVIRNLAIIKKANAAMREDPEHLVEVVEELQQSDCDKAIDEARQALAKAFAPESVVDAAASEGENPEALHALSSTIVNETLNAKMNKILEQVNVSSEPGEEGEGKDHETKIDKAQTSFLDDPALTAAREAENSRESAKEFKQRVQRNLAKTIDQTVMGITNSALAGSGGFNSSDHTAHRKSLLKVAILNWIQGAISREEPLTNLYLTLMAADWEKNNKW